MCVCQIARHCESLWVEPSGPLGNCKTSKRLNQDFPLTWITLPNNRVKQGFYISTDIHSTPVLVSNLVTYYLWILVSRTLCLTIRFADTLNAALFLKYLFEEVYFCKYVSAHQLWFCLIFRSGPALKTMLLGEVVNILTTFEKRSCVSLLQWAFPGVKDILDCGMISNHIILSEMYFILICDRRKNLNQGRQTHVHQGPNQCSVVELIRRW